MCWSCCEFNSSKQCGDILTCCLVKMESEDDMFIKVLYYYHCKSF